MLEIVFQFDPDREETPRRPKDATEARARLDRGNALFSSLRFDAEHDQRQVVPFTLEGVTGAEGTDTPAHQPFAAVLSCSDARVPVELLFQQSLNELFVVRLAGNVVTNESVGSLNYAAQHLGGNVKLLVVLGHSGCGAVNAAVDVYLDPASADDLASTRGLGSIVNRVFVAVRTAAKALDATQTVAPTADEYRARLAEIAVFVNSAIAAMTLKKILGRSVPSDCRVVYGIYDLATRRVQGSEGPGLVPPPASLEELERLVAQVAAADR